MTPAPDDDDDGANAGGIVGGIIGALAGVMCMIISIVSVMYWRYVMHIQQYNSVVNICLTYRPYMPWLHNI